MTHEPMSVHELRDRAESIAMALEEAHAAVERAAEQAASLLRDLDGTNGRITELARFDYQVQTFVATLAGDLGVSDEGGRGDFDIDRLPQDARDLLDLIDAAAERKEAVDAR